VHEKAQARITHTIWGILLVACLLAGGLISMAAGTDSDWDLRNYHLYNAYAQLHGRLFYDLAPAQLQSYYNPLLDIPVYGLFIFFADVPRLYAFVMGLPAGLFGFVFLRIVWDHAALLFAPGAARLIATAIAGVMGLTGAALVPLIGLSTGDIPVAVACAFAYWLVLREVMRRDAGEPMRAGWISLAGLAAGFAVGLKLTAVLFGAAIGLMILFLLGLRLACAAGLAMAAGFVAAYGHHALVLWQATGNPLFPYYNDVFKSPEYFPVRLSDDRFLPRSWLQALFYPFWWLHTNVLVTELPMRDARIAFGFLGVIALVPFLVRRAAVGQRPLWLLIGVAVLSYGFWLKLSSIYRYIVLLEALSAVLVMAALAKVWRGRALPALICFTVVASLALWLTVRPDWGHVPYGQRLLAMDPMPVPPGALVLTGPDPVAYLIPFLPPDIRALGLKTNLVDPADDDGLTRRIRAAIAAHEGPIWSVVDNKTPDTARDAVLAAYRLVVSGDCVLVRTSFEPGGYQFCPIRKSL
jgi:hypothetical protein